MTQGQTWLEHAEAQVMFGQMRTGKAARELLDHDAVNRLLNVDLAKHVVVIRMVGDYLKLKSLHRICDYLETAQLSIDGYARGQYIECVGRENALPAVKSGPFQGLTGGQG